MVVLRSKLAVFGIIGHGTSVRNWYWMETVTKQGVATVGGCKHGVAPSAWSAQASTTRSGLLMSMPGVRDISSLALSIASARVGVKLIAYASAPARAPFWIASWSA